MRELPTDYADREYDEGSKQWMLCRTPFSEDTLSAWADVGEDWSPFWPVAFRWAVLFDRFARSGSERVSAELRQLEKDLRDLVASAESGSSVDDAADAANGVDDDELDAMLDEALGGG